MLAVLKGFAAAALSLAVVCAAIPAHADEGSRPPDALRMPERDILSGLGGSAGSGPTLGEWLRANLHPEEDHGFEVRRRPTRFGDRKLIFSIQGPLMKERTPGISLSLQF